MSDPAATGPDPRRAALDQVLRSSAFSRSDPLRSFLRYVCEMELAGRGDELNEYLIGVEALGKPPAYSTAEDATVRRRAHELRDKLDEAYSTELADVPLRIELPKGRYVPRFVPKVAPLRPPGPAAASHRRWLAPGLWMAAGAALASAGHAALGARATHRVDAVVAEAWGPFLAPRANVTIGLAAPAHYNVLPYPEGPLPPGVRLVPEDWNLSEWYQSHYPLRPGRRLGLHVSGPLRTGEVMGALTAARLLVQAGVDYQILLDKKLPPSAVRGRNLLMFANPEYSELAGTLLERATWTVDYDPERRARVIRPQKDGSPARTFAPGPEWQRPATFGLITVLPNSSEVVPNETRSTNLPKLVLVSCTNSQGCQAAMEFFASASGMRALRDKLRSEGHDGFPPAYQVVVRCDLHLSQPIAGAYEAHVVLPAS